jgi:hypothetical protein
MRLLEYNDDSEPSLTKDFINNLPRYAILSHTWGADDKEVTFEGVVNHTGKDKVDFAQNRLQLTAYNTSGSTLVVLINQAAPSLWKPSTLCFAGTVKQTNATCTC